MHINRVEKVNVCRKNHDETSRHDYVVYIFFIYEYFRRVERFRKRLRTYDYKTENRHVNNSNSPATIRNPSTCICAFVHRVTFAMHVLCNLTVMIESVAILNRENVYDGAIFDFARPS